MATWLRGLLACVAAMAAQPAAAAWLQARTDHFIVYSEGTEASVRAFATRLEQFDKGLRILRAVPNDAATRANPLTIYVVSNEAVVQRLACGAASRCSSVYGFYVPRAGGSVAFTPRRSGDGSPFELKAETVLFHEYTHHFMYAHFPAAYPAWFSEGFAEFNGTARFEKDGALGIGLPANQRAANLHESNLLPIEWMVGAKAVKLTRAQVGALYSRGWLLTHYLTFAPKRKGQLNGYLKAINTGTPALKAATDAFGELKALDRELNVYVRTNRLPYRRIPADMLDIGPIRITALSAGHDAMMPVILQSRRGVDSKQAGKLVLDARRRAAPHPADARVQAALAEAEHDAGHADLAEAAVDRALAADPANRDALLYKGRVLVRRAATAKVTDPAVWKAARSWFVKANRAEADDAEPLILFYDSFRTARTKPTANAIVGLERAFEVAPQDRYVRYRLAYQYLQDGRATEARNVLAPLAFDPHGGENNVAAALVTAIDAGNKAVIAAKLAEVAAAEGS